jgi:mannose-6-phosphate isomerase-like protein (cupin superfamily)
MPQARYVFSAQETIRYRFPTHINDLVMDRSESTTSEAFIVVIEPGGAPPLHIHHDAEQVFYVLDGMGTLQIGQDSPEYYSVKPGDLVRIPPHTFHLIRCTSPSPLRYLSVDCFLDGRPQDEPTWESHVRTLCAQNSWDFDQVRARPAPEGGELNKT